jgi:hypothetical protein
VANGQVRTPPNRSVGITSLTVHLFLVSRKANKEVLPTTQQELQRMQETDIRIRTIGSKV